jgi:hypothetical protein
LIKRPLWQKISESRYRCQFRSQYRETFGNRNALSGSIHDSNMRWKYGGSAAKDRAV